MIQYKKGDLLAVTEGLIIHGCNAQGVMASGVAKAVKAKYPEAFKAYMQDYGIGMLKLGTYSAAVVGKNLTVVNAVTQNYYGRDQHVRYVSYPAIEAIFLQLDTIYDDSTIFNIPKIGSGLGNGNWDTISTIIENTCPTKTVVCWEL